VSQKTIKRPAVTSLPTRQTRTIGNCCGERTTRLEAQRPCRRTWGWGCTERAGTAAEFMDEFDKKAFGYGDQATITKIIWGLTRWWITRGVSRGARPHGARTWRLLLRSHHTRARRYARSAHGEVTGAIEVRTGAGGGAPRSRAEDSRTRRWRSTPRTNWIRRSAARPCWRRPCGATSGRE